MNSSYYFTNDTSTLQLATNLTGDELDDNELNQIIDNYLKKEHTFDSMTELTLKCFYIMFIVTGILTNIVIICVIASNKKLLTSNNLLLINLLVSDILLCIFCMPFTLIAIIRRSWPFGAFMCKVVPFIQAVTTFVSAATISSIAIDRMLQITQNQFTGKGFTTRNLSPNLVKYISNTLFIWILSLLLSAPICVYQNVVEFGIKEMVFYDKCVENWPNNNRGIYSFVILVTQLVIPSSVMLVSHYRIRGHLSEHRLQKMQKQSIDRQITSNDSTNSNTINVNNNEENFRDTVVEEQAINTTITVNCVLSPICETTYFDKELNRNNRITIFLMTVTIIFGISWLPWNLFNVYVDFYPDINLTAHDLYLVLAVCHLIAMSSATTNAIFYGFLHSAIRLELSNIISKIKQYL